MRRYTKIIAGILAILISAGATGMYAIAQDEDKENAKQVVKSVEESKTEDDNSERTASDKNTFKDETVYITTDAEGNTKKIIVSDWLKNYKADSLVKDITNLSEIENVKGNESFQLDGKNLNWSADGKDIYYKGIGNEQSPVEVKISYKLDGKDISAENIVGKSGKVEIKYDFVNNLKKY